MSSIQIRLDELFLNCGSTFDPLAYASFLKDSSTSVESIKASLRRPNDEKRKTHFDTPQPVQSSYVGREEESKRLATSFFSKTKGERKMQKRVVVYGVGGSGKTQFCCKFAQDYQYLCVFL